MNMHRTSWSWDLALQGLANDHTRHMHTLPPPHPCSSTNDLCSSISKCVSLSIADCSLDCRYVRNGFYFCSCMVANNGCSFILIQFFFTFAARHCF